VGKIIIKNLTDVPDSKVLGIVISVIDLGKISNNGKQYCYLCTQHLDGEEYHIVTDLRKCSDVFTFYKAKQDE